MFIMLIDNRYFIIHQGLDGGAHTLYFENLLLIKAPSSLGRTDSTGGASEGCCSSLHLQRHTKPCTEVGIIVM